MMELFSCLDGVGRLSLSGSTSKSKASDKQTKHFKISPISQQSGFKNSEYLSEGVLLYSGAMLRSFQFISCATSVSIRRITTAKRFDVQQSRLQHNMADIKNTTNPSPAPEQGAGAEQHKPLPLPPTSDQSTGVDDGVKQLNVQGGSVSFDHLGPIVVNQDGTMSRVANWPNMTQIERENTIRILGKRNQLRLAALRKAAEETGKAGVGETKN